MFQKLIEIVIYLEPILLPLIVLVLLVKIILFIVYKTKKQKLYQLFYYNDYQIVNASNFNRASIKIVQNCLSFYLVFLILVDVLALYTCHKNTLSLAYQN